MLLNSELLLVIFVFNFSLSFIVFVRNFKKLNNYQKYSYFAFSFLTVFAVVVTSFSQKAQKSLVIDFGFYSLLFISFLIFLFGLFYSNKKPRVMVGESKEEQLNTLAFESKKIIDNSQSLVVKIDMKGNIVFASSNYSKLFASKTLSAVGLNVFKLNEQFGFYNNSWFENAIMNHSSTDESKIVVNGEPRWISWNNDVLYGRDGKVEYIISVGHEVTELMKVNKKLEFKSMHDSLTNLLNYRGLSRKVKELKNVREIYCFFIAVQNFASIQNYYGIDVGDEVLKEFSKEFSMYNSQGHLCARLAGSGFVVMIINPSEEEIAKVLFEMEKSILKDIQIDNMNIHIKRNIGYAVYPGDTTDIMQLVSLANLAMNDSANNHHNEISCYNTMMSKTLADNIKIASKLRGAITNSLIDIYFQKIINTNNSEVEYLEALARWNDDELGYVNPRTFLTVAQKSNLIDALDEYLIKKAIKKFAVIKTRSEYRNAKLSINLSPTSFLHNTFVSLVESCVHENNINPQDVCIEISENTFVNNLDLCKYFIKKYKEKGFLIAIDDFGKDYSSLSVLGSIEYDVIKIDGSFVSKIYSEKNQAIIEMIVKIANLNNNQIIAESVENKHQADILRQLNCFIQQGYYFHKPEKVV